MRSFILSMICVLTAIMPSSAYGQAPQTPGKEHEELKSMEGTWDAKLKMVDGTEMAATSEFRMICNGMWLESDLRGDFGGLPFHGRGLDSYDSEKKLFTSTWVDSMSGSPMVLTGTKKGKVTTLTGEGPGPGGVAKYKTESTHESGDRMTFKMMIVADGREVEMMTVTYVRRTK